MMGTLYDISEDEKAFWGDKYVGPDVGTRLPHGGWTRVARYAQLPHLPEPAEVFVCAMPARFYRIKGGGLDIGTGSCNPTRAIANTIANAIAQGMLSAMTPES